MSYHGDIRLGDTIDIQFTTRAFATGVPTTLAGTPSVAAYIGNSTTEITAGITLTVDLDSRTGLNNVRIVATSGNGFATATNVSLVITAGTVGGTSVVGEQIGSFSIENRSALMPTTPARTLVVDAAGLADANVVKVGPSGSGTAQTARDLGDKANWAIVDEGTAQAGSGTTIQLRSGLNLTSDSIPNGAYVEIVGGTGVGQTRFVDSYVNATDTATISPAWTTNPDNTSVYKLRACPPASTGSVPGVNVLQVSGDATAADNLEAALDGTGGVTITAGLTGNITGNLSGSVGSVTGAVGSVTGNVGGNVTGSVGSVTGAVGSVTGNVGGNVVGSVGSVTGAVGSVTGNVGGNVTGSVGSVVAAVATTSNIKKNQALSNFAFLMTDSVLHAPATGKTVSVTRAIDNGAQGAGALSAVTEVGNGIYRVNFAAGDLNGNVIMLRATATGCDDTFERIVTQP